MPLILRPCICLYWWQVTVSQLIKGHRPMVLFLAVVHCKVLNELLILSAARNCRPSRPNEPINYIFKKKKTQNKYPSVSTFVFLFKALLLV